MSLDRNTRSQELPSVIGIDLGGTQIRVAVLQKMHMLARVATWTGENPTPERVLARIDRILRQVLVQAGITLDEIAGIGIATPGPLDYRTGTIYSPPNLAAWVHVPLRDILQAKYQKQVFVENDANAAALGEYLFGAGQGSRDMIYMTVSTGIGAGIITNGKIMEGASGAAGELGHITIDWRGERCSCGNVGCLEALASGTAIARKANAVIASGQGAELLAFARTMLEHTSTIMDKGLLSDLEELPQPLDMSTTSQPPTEEIRLTAHTVAQAAEAGIPLARSIINEAAEALGVGLVNILHTFNPEVVILGGGVMQMGAMLMDPAMRIVKERTMPANLTGKRPLAPAQESQVGSEALIVPAQLGTNAGLIGAGALLYHYQHLLE